jgi:hypothetical protein
MNERSAEELDLMADAYERACDTLARISLTPSDEVETARTCLVSGIVEAFDRGVRNIDVLIAAALSKLSEEQSSAPT